MSMRRVISLLFLLAAPACAVDGDSGALDFSAVALNPADPAQAEIGRLRYLGGLHLSSGDPRFGGLSGLRWRDGRLIAIGDNGHFVSFEPDEIDGRLIGVRAAQSGAFLGLEGESLSGKAEADAESLTLDANGDWLVSFERRHRVWRYETPGAAARETGIDPEAVFGALADNNGVEAMAGPADRLFLCAERASEGAPNCFTLEDGAATAINAEAPAPLDRMGGKPTDADAGADGALYLLFRSYNPLDGSAAAIVSIAPDGAAETIAVLTPPLSVDNFEGLAVREENGRLFLYLVSDDNFSARQRTLLLKFELIDEE